MSLTTSDIAEMRRLREAAAALPWEYAPSNDCYGAYLTDDNGGVVATFGKHGEGDENALFVEAMINHAEALLSAAEAGQRAHDEAIETAAKIADSEREQRKGDARSQDNPADAYICGCEASTAARIASAIRSLKLTSPSPGKETT